MDWTKVKLTADDFERGTSSGGSNYDHTWEEGKCAGSDCIRTKNIIPVSKAINIPIKNGWGYFVSYFGDNKKQLATSGWKTTVETIKLSSNIKYITLILKKANGTIITTSNLSETLSGYIWTAGQPEFGKLKDGSVYTKGRNLLKNSSSGFTFFGSDIASNIRIEPGKLTLLKAGHTNAYKLPLISVDETEKITQQAVDLVFGLDIKTTGMVSNHTFAIDIRNTDHSQRILGSRVIITPDLNGKWQRIYSVIKGVEKRPWILPCFDFPNVQGSEIGATIEYKNWSLMYGDEYYPWSSAPEDVDNPTEAV